MVETTPSSPSSSHPSSGGRERMGPLPRINPALTMRGHLVRREGGREGGRAGGKGERREGGKTFICSLGADLGSCVCD